MGRVWFRIHRHTPGDYKGGLQKKVVEYFLHLWLLVRDAENGSDSDKNCNNDKYNWDDVNDEDDNDDDKHSDVWFIIFIWK